jgi:Mor family transcriptional regulator
VGSRTWCASGGSIPDLKRNVISFCQKHQPNVVLIEDKGNGTALIQDLRRDPKFKWPIIPIEPEGDKIMRAQRTSPVCEAGLLVLPQESPWLGDVRTRNQPLPLGRLHGPGGHAHAVPGSLRPRLTAGRRRGRIARNGRVQPMTEKDFKLDELPDQIKEIVGVIGLTNTMRLVNIYGGSYLVFSVKERTIGTETGTRRDIIKRLLGKKTAAKFFRHFNNRRVYLARCTQALATVRARQVRADSDSMAMAELQLKYDMSERQIYRILKADPSRSADGKPPPNIPI